MVANLNLTPFLHFHTPFVVHLIVHYLPDPLFSALVIQGQIGEAPKG